MEPDIVRPRKAAGQLVVVPRVLSGVDLDATADGESAEAILPLLPLLFRLLLHDPPGKLLEPVVLLDPLDVSDLVELPLDLGQIPLQSRTPLDPPLRFESGSASLAEEAVGILCRGELRVELYRHAPPFPVIELDLPTSSPTGDVLQELTFRIGLGRDSVVSLTLENAEAIDGDVAMSVELGVVHILGICYEGGARLINPDGVVALRPITNTASASSGFVVEMETIENGPTDLRLYDLHGREVRTYISGPLSPGRRLMVLEGDGMSTGLYLLILQTPTERRSVMVEVRG